jgi:hypothetical protein
LVSCLLLEDFPEVPSIADVRRCGEKYRAAGGRIAVRALAWGDCAAQPAACGILLESSGVRTLYVHGGDFMAQNFQNHARYVPLFHFFVLPMLLLNVGWEIRLDMQLRLQGALPADLRARISEFTVNQLVALRFASDAELAGLAGKVLAENLQDRKAIKRMIQNWQVDELRA